MLSNNGSGKKVASGQRMLPRQAYTLRQKLGIRPSPKPAKHYGRKK